MLNYPEVFKDAKGEWRWHRKDVCGNVVSRSTEGYKNKTDCENNSIRDLANDIWLIYPDVSGQYRWNVKSRNGNIIGQSIKGFKARSECVAHASTFGYKGN